MEKKIMDFACSIDRIKEINEIYSAFQVDVQGHSGQHDEGSSLDRSTLLPPTVVCGRKNDCDVINCRHYSSTLSEVKCCSLAHSG
jgi:hypothetical protein